MISLDAIILEFVGKNLLTITLIIVLFNGISRITKWTWDEKVGKVLDDILDRLRPSAKLYGNGKPPDPPTPPVG